MRLVFRAVEFLAAVTAVLVAAVAIFGYFQVGVPVVAIRESCNPSWPNEGASAEEIVAETTARLWKFYEQVDAFAIENDGRIAYVDIEIEASASSLSCALSEGAFGEYIGDTDFEPGFWINFDEDPWSSDFLFNLPGPYGGRWEFSVPINQRELPKNGQYRALDHGRVLSVAGPFLVQHLEANGFGQVTLFPQKERVLTEAEISCARLRLDAPEWLRKIVPCF